MRLNRLVQVTAIAALSTLAIGTAASANTPWENNHPRQDQVLDRVQNQRHEVRRDVRDGELSRTQAHRLLARDNHIAREDHIIAHANGGYITKHEQRVLNGQENRVHRHIPS
jgi:hypothetical protein